MAKKYPAQYFAGMVTLAKVIRWEVGTPGAFDRPRTPEEVMDRLEERIGPKGRKLFEQFLQKGESARGAAAAARASAAGAAAAQAVHGIAVGRLRRRPNQKGVGHSCNVSRQHDHRALIRVPAHRCPEDSGACTGVKPCWAARGAAAALGIAIGCNTAGRLHSA